MSGTNPPSSAATARALEATQSLKRSVQAAFDGTFLSPVVIINLSVSPYLYSTA